MKSILIGLGVLAVVALVGVLLLAAGFSRQIARAEARLTEIPPGPVRTDLPAALQAFAERGLAGARPGAAVRLTQAAEMRLDRGATWTALSARQTIAAAEPGFAWVAEMKIGPIPAVRVIDSYVDGVGRLEIRGLGAVPMGSDTGPEATLGEAQRYLAELPWVPDAILTNRAITWTELPDGVGAALETAGGTASVRFGFDAAGDIATMEADERPAKLADGTVALLPWRGWFKDYAEIGGRRIPVQGEVGYVYPEGYESYWRGRITGYAVVAE